MVGAYKTGSDYTWTAMTAAESALVVDPAMATKMTNIDA